MALIIVITCGQYTNELQLYALFIVHDTKSSRVENILFIRTKVMLGSFPFGILKQLNIFVPYLLLAQGHGHAQVSAEVTSDFTYTLTSNTSHMMFLYSWLLRSRKPLLFKYLYGCGPVTTSSRWRGWSHLPQYLSMKVVQTSNLI